MGRSRSAPPRPGEGLFQLSILGGATERRFTQLRPDIERMPWGTLAKAKIKDALREEAQGAWTRVTYSEHCAAAGMSAAVLAMVQACAPVDLVAVASRFVFDELSHAELCARIVGELGGCAPLPYSAANIYQPADDAPSPVAAACVHVVRVFCANECLALPLVRAEVKRGSGYALIDALVRRIAKDEAPHAAFGWVFLDWAAPYLDHRDRKRLRAVGEECIADLEAFIGGMSDTDNETLGWLPSREFRRAARYAIDEEIAAPLKARGLL